MGPKKTTQRPIKDFFEPNPTSPELVWVSNKRSKIVPYEELKYYKLKVSGKDKADNNLEIVRSDRFWDDREHNSKSGLVVLQLTTMMLNVMNG